MVNQLNCKRTFRNLFLCLFRLPCPQLSTENKRSCLSRLSHVFRMLAGSSTVFGVLLLIVYIGARTNWHNDLLSQGIVVFLIGFFLTLRVMPLLPGANVASKCTTRS